MPRVAIATPDFDDIVDTFRNKLGMPVVDLSDTYLPTLGARLAMCVPPGGSHIELMSPAVAAAPLSQSLQRFLDRRGAGLFALMLEAVDPDAEAELLARRGLRVLPLMPGAGGRDIHPASTHGVLVRIYPENSYLGPRPAVSPINAVTGIQRVIIAVTDLAAAVVAYGERLGLVVDPPAQDNERGVRCALVHPPRGGTIELVAVHDSRQAFAGAVAAHLASNPEGLYALVLQAPDPVALLEPLRTSGLQAHPASDAADVIEITRASLFGVLVRIEPAPDGQRPPANDLARQATDTDWRPTA